jgi:hypothetical protein
MADSTADKARKARERAKKESGFPKIKGMSTINNPKAIDKVLTASQKTQDIVTGRQNNPPSNLKKVEEFFNGPKKLTPKQEREAKLMQQRRAIDTGKTAARAEAIAKRADGGVKKSTKTVDKLYRPSK